MTRLNGGPAAGQILLLQRAPLFLRVTQNADGRWDALDQIDDTPAFDERIHAYVRTGVSGSAHINLGRKGGMWCAVSEYRYMEEQPPDEVMRHNNRWQEWATAAAVTFRGAPQASA